MSTNLSDGTIQLESSWHLQAIRHWVWTWIHSINTAFKFTGPRLLGMQISPIMLSPLILFSFFFFLEWWGRHLDFPWIVILLWHEFFSFTFFSCLLYSFYFISTSTGNDKGCHLKFPWIVVESSDLLVDPGHHMVLLMTHDEVMGTTQ